MMIVFVSLFANTQLDFTLFQSMFMIEISLALSFTLMKHGIILRWSSR
jgi:hypothetical protein